MALFRDEKWRCENCNKTYKSNPSKCENCGHTVLQQYNSDSGVEGTTRTPRQQTGSPKSTVWYCSKCKQKHDEPREACKVCGTTDLVEKEVGGRNESTKGGYQQPASDAETISNVSEATTRTQHTPQNPSKLVGWLYWVAVIIVVGLLVLSVV